jgi:hypothetical protein
MLRESRRSINREFFTDDWALSSRHPTRQQSRKTFRGIAEPYQLTNNELALSEDAIDSTPY